MDMFYIMDTMFDLLNESDNLNLQELVEDEAAGLFFLTTSDDTRIRIHCSILDDPTQ